MTAATLWRLHAQIEAARATPFAWGRHDCCLFAADCVLALTGVDHAAAWRGTYTDAVGAQRVLMRQGGLRGLAGRAGAPIAPLAARVGDVGIVTHAGRELLAVCAGEVWVCPGLTGLAAQPLDAALAAWRIDHA